MNAELKEKLIKAIGELEQKKLFGKPEDIHGWHCNLITATMYRLLRKMHPEDKEIQFNEPEGTYLGKTEQREAPTEEDPEATITVPVVNPVFAAVVKKAEIDQLDLRFKDVTLTFPGKLGPYEKTFDIFYASSLCQNQVKPAFAAEMLTNNLIS